MRRSFLLALTLPLAAVSPYIAGTELAEAGCGEEEEHARSNQAVDNERRVRLTTVAAAPIHPIVCTSLVRNIDQALTRMPSTELTRVLKAIDEAEQKINRLGNRNATVQAYRKLWLEHLQGDAVVDGRETYHRGLAAKLIDWNHINGFIKEIRESFRSFLARELAGLDVQSSQSLLSLSSLTTGTEEAGSFAELTLAMHQAVLLVGLCARCPEGKGEAPSNPRGARQLAAALCAAPTEFA